MTRVSSYKVALWLETVFLVAVMAPLLLIIEWINPEVARSPDRRERRTDITYVGVQVLWLPVCGLVTTLLIARIALDRLPLWHVGELGAMSAGVAYTLAEMVAYWMHRLEHRSSLLWRVHSVHHAATQVGWMTSFRFHPIDVAVQQCVPPLVVVAVGLPAVSLAPYLLVAGVVTLFAHCNTATPSMWLRHIVVTPGYHRSHHEAARSATNFALTLPVVDMIFGTASFDVGERSFGTTSSAPVSGFWQQFRWGLGLSKKNQAE